MPHFTPFESGTPELEIAWHVSCSREPRTPVRENLREIFIQAAQRPVRQMAMSAAGRRRSSGHLAKLHSTTL
jgi:hypothetical protein